MKVRIFINWHPGDDADRAAESCRRYGVRWIPTAFGTYVLEGDSLSALLRAFVDAWDALDHNGNIRIRNRDAFAVVEDGNSNVYINLLQDQGSRLGITVKEVAQ
jgi:hypothetical protein